MAGDALAVHETAIDADAIILRYLREWFAPELTGAQE